MSETNNREVKADDVEVLNVANEDAPEGDEDGDEEVIPPVEETGEETQEDGDKDAESDKSSQSEETQEDAPEGEGLTADSSKTKNPAPVEGETPREKALRMEVQRQKRLRREESIQRLTGDKPAAKAEENNAQDVQELRDMGYSDEEIANMEKAIDVLAKKKGYVKSSTLQAQTYQQTVNTVLDSFLEAHPEYSPKNDLDDLRWGRFEEILKSGIYNIQGKSSKELGTIFRKVHADVEDELGEATVTTEKKQEAAQRQKIHSVSHSGGTKSSTSAKPAPKKAANVPSIFKGFDAEDFEG